MDKLEIQYKLRIRGVTLSDIATNCGVSQSMISNVLNRRSRSAKIEEAVAKTLELALSSVFPEWYDKLNRRMTARVARLMIADRHKAQAEIRRFVEQAAA